MVDKWDDRLEAIDELLVDEYTVEKSGSLVGVNEF